jgi:hypothetical protein
MVWLIRRLLPGSTFVPESGIYTVTSPLGPAPAGAR